MPKQKLALPVGAKKGTQDMETAITVPVRVWKPGNEVLWMTMGGGTGTYEREGKPVEVSFTNTVPSGALAVRIEGHAYLVPVREVVSQVIARHDAIREGRDVPMAINAGGEEES